ncbi:MAG: tetratricopeptide repeat protein [Rhodobacteraceae bacterium]|nr:tetratricopeptide repeat protein [Paracoccaceae bacterium]
MNEHAPSLVAIGAAISMVTLDQSRAKSKIDQALAIDGNNAWGWLRSGWSKTYQRDFDGALADFDRAQTLSPRDPFLFNIEFGRAFAAGASGNYEDAIRLVKKGLVAGPGVTWAYRDLASFLANADRQLEAEEAVRQLLLSYPNLTIQRVIDGMPPTVRELHTKFFDGLLKAGVPGN